MNNNDAIIFLAQDNAKTFRPLRKEETEDLQVPFFQVRKDNNGLCGYTIDYFNYKTHDNAPRMQYYCDYLLKNIFPNVDSSCDLSGFYPIELHDSYSYLHNDVNYDNVLTFAKKKQDKYPTLIPDPFMIGNYGGRLDVSDTIVWDNKISKAAFFGVTTGNKNPLQNDRLQICQWSAKNRDISDFYITRIAQMDPQEVVKAYPDDIQQMYCNPINQQEQYKYKFLLSIDGNTCSYDRLCWIMKSNSLLFKYPSNDILWYYPLILENTHFVDVNEDNIRKKMTFYMNNPAIANHIVKNANTFVKNFTTPVNTMLYSTYLFEHISENKA